MLFENFNSETFLEIAFMNVDPTPNDIQLGIFALLWAKTHGAALHALANQHGTISVCLIQLLVARNIVEVGSYST